MSTAPEEPTRSGVAAPAELGFDPAVLRQKYVRPDGPLDPSKPHTPGPALR